MTDFSGLSVALATPFDTHGLMVSAPLIVKYRDARTDAATALEGALRS